MRRLGQTELPAILHGVKDDSALFKRASSHSSGERLGVGGLPDASKAFDPKSFPVRTVKHQRSSVSTESS